MSEQALPTTVSARSADSPVRTAPRGAACGALR